MSSPRSSRSGAAGSQAPRLRLVHAPRSRTYGDLACELAANYGLTADPWQELVVNDWLRVKQGRWANSECGLSVPRQNGKNGAVEIRELFGMVGLGEKILHTAHEVKTARRHFRRLQHFFGKKVNDPHARYPELNALVTEVRQVNGQEAIVLRNGGSIELVARTSGSGRGFTVDMVVCDEAQDMSDEDQEALASTTSSAPLANPQWVYLGTPPGPKVNGEVFTRIRKAGLERVTGFAWHEWSIPDGADINNPREWTRANPGLITGRLLWDQVEKERAKMSDVGFGRERGGMWSEAATTAVIHPESWTVLADPGSWPADRFILGVDANPEQTLASIVLAGSRDDGRIHLEIVEQRAGPIAWLPLKLRDLVGKNQITTIVVDGKSPASAVLDDLRKLRLPLTVVGADEALTAPGMFLNAVNADEVRHIDQPQLSAAVDAGRKRVSGKRWGWAPRNDTTDITPLVAASLAAWGVKSAKVRPRRRGTGTITAA